MKCAHDICIPPSSHCLFSRISFELPITRTFFDFPRLDKTAMLRRLRKSSLRFPLKVRVVGSRL